MHKYLIIAITCITLPVGVLGLGTAIVMAMFGFINFCMGLALAVTHSSPYTREGIFKDARMLLATSAISGVIGGVAALITIYIN